MRHVAALKVRGQPYVDARVDGRAGGRKVEVARSDIAEHRIDHGAMRTERELSCATVNVIVLVEDAVGVASFEHSLDDVVAHHQNAAVAAGVANEALALRARHHDGVVE